MSMRDAIGKKLGRNEPCWCNSGKEYKYCHLPREQGRVISYEEIAHKFDVAMDHKTCLHPDAPQACTDIISAHSLQRARVLRPIADADGTNQNQVYSFIPTKYDKNGKLILQSASWWDASTFTAFCKSHDNTAFAPLEKAPFFSGTMEQIFLIGYRAVCWEYFDRILLLKGLPTVLESDQGRSRDQQVNIQRTAQLQQVGAEIAILNIRELKSMMDVALISKDYSSFEAYEIVVSILPGCTLVASTGMIFPTWSLDGKQLQIFDRENPVRLEGLTFGIDIRANSTVSIVFLWPRTDMAPRKYVESVDALDDRQLAEYVIQFFFSYLGNTYFAKTWWDGLSTNDRQLLIKLIESDGNKPIYDLQRSIAPWQVIGRKWL